MRRRIQRSGSFHCVAKKQRSLWLMMAPMAAALVGGEARGVTLYWDAGGVRPRVPAQGGGNWDTTTADWSNLVTDQTWVNDGTSTAVFGALGGRVSLTTPINAAGVTFGGGSGYTIAGPDALNLTGTAPTIAGNSAGEAAIEPPITGARG